MIGAVVANRYAIVREVGRGGSGAVYLARDLVDDREVAVKLLESHALSDDAADRVRRQARAVAEAEHPNVIPLHDVVRHDSAFVLVMPFVRGTSLRLLLLNGRCSLQDAVTIGIGVADALDHGHACGVLHRDLKPEHILVERDERGRPRARVAAFGVAAAELVARATASGEVVHSGIYLSPEQIGAGEVDARSDVYSFGVVLYEALAGRPPYTGSGSSLYYKIAYSRPKRLSLLRPDVPASLERLVHACLEKAPPGRPPSARALADALVAIRHDLDGGGDDDR
jgi:serine/threonine-protein kinase